MSEKIQPQNPTKITNRKIKKIEALSEKLKQNLQRRKIHKSKNAITEK